MGDPLPFPSFSSCLFQLSSFSLAYLHQSSFLFLFILRPLLLFLPSDSQESLHVLGRFERPGPVGRRVRRAVCFLLDESRRSSVSPSVPPPPSSCRPLSRHFLRRTFTGVFPLSSRKKFFYNFRIVLFRLGSSSHVQVVLPKSVSPLHHQPPSLRPPTSVCVFYFLVFTSFNPSYATARFLTVFLLSLSFRRRLCFFF